MVFGKRLARREDLCLTKLNRGTACATCGRNHKGLFDLGIDHPAQWISRPDGKMDKDNVLLEDFCVVNGEDFFVSSGS